MSETNTENRDEQEQHPKQKDSKVFSQEDVDRIIASRVYREQEKIQQLALAAESANNRADEFDSMAKGVAEKLTELELRNSELDREKLKYEVAFETGIDPQLIGSLKWDNKEELNSAVETLRNAIGSNQQQIGFNGKTYHDDESSTRFANNVIRKYRERGTSL